MRDWMDFNGDGEIDDTERFFADEMLCGSREEHKALFGYAGDFGEEHDEEEELEDDLMCVGLSRYDLEDMDEDEKRKALEDAGLDPDDYEDF